MILYPAVDMLEGQAVRLRQGKRDDKTVYGDPFELALKWKSKGADWLHLVDLDAAFDGKCTAQETIRRIAEAFNGQVELGGGIRTLEDLDERMSLGVGRCVLGTAAVENPALVAEACRKYPGHIAVGIDAKDGKVASHGWLRETNTEAIQLALSMKEIGVTTVIYTDISRDGMLSGPNIPAIRSMIRETGMDIIASGGISSLNDVHELMDAGAAGVIMGKSLYEKTIRLEDAVETVTFHS